MAATPILKAYLVELLIKSQHDMSACLEHVRSSYTKPHGKHKGRKRDLGCSKLASMARMAGMKLKQFEVMTKKKVT